MTREDKNAQIAKTFGETRKRRKTQVLQVREVKLRPTQEQEAAINQLFLEAKWLRNDALSHGIKGYVPRKTVQVKNRDGDFETRNLAVLGSQIKQSVISDLRQDMTSLAKKRDKGYKIGKLQFCKQMRSVNLKQCGTTYNVFPGENSVSVQKIPGKIRAYGLHQLTADRELANARLIHKASGYYLKIVTYISVELWDELDKQRFVPGTRIGVDLGVKDHITLSDGRKINVLVPETPRLKRLQRHLQRQYTKGRKSKNYIKTLKKIKREYEKMDNLKDEKARKIVSELLKYEEIYFQDENLSGWKVLWGKQLHHSVLGRIKSLLIEHKRAFMLDKYAATTQTCPECLKKTKHDLSKRIFECKHCGHTNDRDVHAAQNMIWMYNIPRDTGELTPK